MGQKKQKTTSSNLTRRNFHKLAMAAFGGVVSGSSLFHQALAGEEEESQLLKEPHVCCGLNTCKGQGKGDDNDCAGMGSCASAERHSCQGQNACAGQAGCGEKPGENACNGQGACAVPLTKKTWKKARANFEAAMKKAGRTFGKPPADCKQAG